MARVRAKEKKVMHRWEGGEESNEARRGTFGKGQWKSTGRHKAEQGRVQVRKEATQKKHPRQVRKYCAGILHNLCVSVQRWGQGSDRRRIEGALVGDGEREERKTEPREILRVDPALFF